MIWPALQTSIGDWRILYWVYHREEIVRIYRIHIARKFMILIATIGSRKPFYTPPAPCIMSFCEFAKASARRLRHERSDLFQ